MRSSATWSGKNSKQKSWNKSDTYREKKELSYNVSVSAFLSCATNEALTASPKDPTSERTSSFLGQNLKFARGNLFALFE